jgi:hypothetical protein
MSDDKFNFQHQGLKWIYEMELINSPQLINNLKLNILSVSESISETELLMSADHKAILVLLDLTWFGRVFKKREIFLEVEERIKQLLPSYRLRVIDDKELFKLAVKKVQSALTGGKKNEKSNTSNVNAKSSDTKSDISGGELQSNVSSDSKKQS